MVKNFVISEFKCKDGTEVPDELKHNVEKLMENLQVIRDKCTELAEKDSPLYINSGYRTVKYNKKVGGSPKSQHLEAKAADIRSNHFTPKKLYEIILNLIEEKKIHNGGVGLYNTFVHYDIRSKAARW